MFCSKSPITQFYTSKPKLGNDVITLNYVQRQRNKVPNLNQEASLTNTRSLTKKGFSTEDSFPAAPAAAFSVSERASG